MKKTSDGTEWAGDENTTYEKATPTTDGLMSSTDKSKMDGIEAEANKTTIINDVTTGGTTSALSAEQGKTLKGLIDSKIKLLTQTEYDKLTSEQKMADILYVVHEG